MPPVALRCYAARMAEPSPHYETLTAGRDSPARWLLILHGAFGSGRNWAGVAKRILNRRPEWGAALVDLREHGRSVNRPGEATLAAAADDLDRVAEQLDGGAPVLLGHSLGGKVALRRAADRPPNLRQVWIIDSTPAALAPDEPIAGDAWDMLRRVRRLPGPFESRSAAVAALQNEGLSLQVASWMAMNLDRDDDKTLRWRFDPDRLEVLLRDFYETDLWPAVAPPPAAPPPASSSRPHGLDLHFVRASRSSALTDAVADRIEAAAGATGRVHLHTIEGGHWLNADNPDAIANLLADHLPRP